MTATICRVSNAGLDCNELRLMNIAQECAAAILHSFGMIWLQSSHTFFAGHKPMNGLKICSMNFTIYFVKYYCQHMDVANRKNFNAIHTDSIMFISTAGQCLPGT